MIVTVCDRGFRLDYMNEDDMRSLRCLIKTGSLTESRNWHGVLNEIDIILRDK
jgi:hypothetical protein